MSQVPLLGGLFLIHHISDSLYVTAHPAHRRNCEVSCCNGQQTEAAASQPKPTRCATKPGRQSCDRCGGPAIISSLAEDIWVRCHFCRKTARCFFYFWAKREHHPKCQLWISPPGLESERAFASSSLHWRITLRLTRLMENLIDTSG